LNENQTATQGDIAGRPFRLADVEAWFARHGATDVGYLQAHFDRFERTHAFGSAGLPPQARVLDIGCHWLHQAHFFARSGCRVTGADAPNTLREHSVQSAAREMGIDLVSYTRLDLGQGLCDLAGDEYDLVVFSEIIEHLAFNPLVFWKQVYRVLKPGGRIVVTTPNSLYHRSLVQRLSSLMTAGEYGIRVDDIFNTGTYGHHWKEFSIAELGRYFQTISSDFMVEDFAIETFGKSLEEERTDAAALCREMSARHGAFDFGSIVADMESKGMHPHGSQILLNVRLTQKAAGVPLSPPWLVE
jgi:2-polyprenyl-3-methyl-5-hydroxy-6-metoxy-1,4-benzoquinol methylase